MSSWEMEYTALRNEILKRIELRQHVVLATLTIAGLFLGFGIREKAGLVTLVYPIIAAFLSMAWAQNDSRIGDLGNYIRVNFENAKPDVRYLKWESHMRKIRGGSAGRPFSGRYVSMSGGGIFLYTQAIAVVVGISRCPDGDSLVLFIRNVPVSHLSEHALFVLILALDSIPLLSGHVLFVLLLTLDVISLVLVIAVLSQNRRMLSYKEDI